MKNQANKDNDFAETMNHFEKLPEWGAKFVEAYLENTKAAQIYWNGVLKYTNEFMTPFWIALNSFSDLEQIKAARISPVETLRDYMELLQFNNQIGTKGLTSSFEAMTDFNLRKMTEALGVVLNTLSNRNGEDISEYAARQRQLMNLVVYEYPKAILDIEPEYGFHFDNGGYVKAAETERFDLYQVLPQDPQVEVRADGKPVIIVPPYVLGANILAFLPGEGKSYVHAFANQGIPTYIRILKDIDLHPAVQTMSGEDDASDTRFFCEQVYAKHGKAVTLNGFCQGGFMTLCAILSGELDGLVDAHITCVAPMDGTRSQSLVEYLQHLPARFRDLGYALKTLPNGNQVVDGKVMSWVYKLKSMEREAPVSTFFRDLSMFDKPAGKPMNISKTAAAINYWLLYDRNDLPLGITQMSFDSYTKPISKDGTLPVTLFGRSLNIKKIKEKGINWLICIAEQDDLVDEPAALAPLDFLEAEVTVFPKGHGAIATSWSVPTSTHALQTCFVHPASKMGECRGPVRYQLDLDEAMRNAGKPAPKKKAGRK